MRAKCTEPRISHFHRVGRKVDLSVVIVNYNTKDLLLDAVSRLMAASKRIRTKVIIVDNASRDGSVEAIKRELPQCELIENSNNVGFGRANNQAIERVEGEFVLLLNTDAFVAADTLEKTLAYIRAHPSCGVLGVRLIGRDGEPQPCARSFPTPWRLFLHRTGLGRGADELVSEGSGPHQCDWVPGCYYLVRKKVLDTVGLFDPRYFLYYEEVDHCLAVKRAGWNVEIFPGASVVHIGGESAKTDSPVTQGGRQIERLQIESELLYFRKNHGAAFVWLHVVLVSLADAFNGAKRLIRPRKHSSFVGTAAHAALVWVLFRRTQWATRPTR